MSDEDDILLSDIDVDDDIICLDDSPSPPARTYSQASSISSTLTVSNSQTSASTTSSITSYRVTKPKNTTTKGKPKDKDKDKEKAEQKEAKRLERERKKEDELRARELRKATSEVQRSVKVGEAIKHLIVMMDEVLVTRFDALTPIIVASDIKCDSIVEPLIENSICFKREILQQAMGDDLKVTVVSKFVDEDQVLVLLETEKLISMIHEQLSPHDYNSAGNDADVDLTTWVNSIKSILSDNKLTLLIYDLEKYYRKLKKSTQQDFRNRVLNGNGDTQPQNKRKKKQAELPELSPTEVQSALIEMQLRTGVNYRVIKNVGELSASIIQYAKAIADAPFKKQKNDTQGFDWHAISDATGSIKVEKDGITGLKKLWVEQLQQFNSVGADVALAIAARYPSPTTLMEAYKECNNHEEGQAMLKDLSATTGIGPLARTRKVGVETSKKLYRFFNSTDGQRFLGSTLDSR